MREDGYTDVPYLCQLEACTQRCFVLLPTSISIVNSKYDLGTPELLSTLPVDASHHLSTVPHS